MTTPASALVRRPRRLRSSDCLRRLVCENRLTVDDLVMPIFVSAGEGIANDIGSMPGIRQYSLDRLHEELDVLLERGITRILVFGIPAQKDSEGSDSFCDHGIVQQVLHFLKSRYPQFYVMTDVCFCEYTSHGHCGVLREDGTLDNDATLLNLQKQAVSHAEAGADLVAPSGMIDGMIGAMRSALDEAGFVHVPIMSYAVKYASAYYGPFREAVGSAPQFGDRKSYQMDPANGREAMEEARLDLAQGADILMVKPALAYLDIVRRLRDAFDVPIACYNVSGEYAMIKAAGERGWVDAEAVALESLLSMKRAGADIIISYFARDLAPRLSP